MPELAAGNARHLAARVGQLRLDQLDVAQQGATGFRQLDAAPAPVIELGAEFLLQPVHALGEPRLGDVHRLGRVTEIEAFGGGKKELQLTVIHTMSL